jgi:hypothetical protein
MKNSPSLTIARLATTAVAIGLASSASFASAISPSPTPNAAAAAHLAAIQTKGDADITARLTSLNTLIAKVGAATRLSASQKTSLTSEMQVQVTGLTTLKTSIDADTTPATARADYDKIFTEHFIYAFYIPRINRIMAADAETEATATLVTLATTLQSYVTQAKASGNDVTSIQAALADMQAKTADATTQSQSVLNALLPLTATGYPGNKAIVQGATAAINTGRSDLKTARSDAGAIVTSLKKMLGLK